MLTNRQGLRIFQWFGWEIFPRNTLMLFLGLFWSLCWTLQCSFFQIRPPLKTETMTQQYRTTLSQSMIYLHSLSPRSARSHTRCYSQKTVAVLKEYSLFLYLILYLLEALFDLPNWLSPLKACISGNCPYHLDFPLNTQIPALLYSLNYNHPHHHCSHHHILQ